MNAKDSTRLAVSLIDQVGGEKIEAVTVTSTLGKFMVNLMHEKGTVAAEDGDPVNIMRLAHYLASRLGFVERPAPSKGILRYFEAR